MIFSQKMKPMITLLLVIFQFASCTNTVDFPPSSLAYQVNTPDKILRLPDVLTEISGLSLAADGKYLVAVQDENGIIFYLDKNTGKIVQETKFGDDGDYEGIEAVGKDIYVVKSTGTIYRVGSKEKEVEKFNFALGSENDVEGLAYEPKNNRLLIACKGTLGSSEEYKDAKGIYAFDVNKKNLSEKPVYVVRLQDIKNYLEQAPAFAEKDHLIKSFSKEGKEFGFGPSSISVHPKTGEIYILSSVGKLIIVLNAAGKIVTIDKLDKKIHNQPEGLSFDADGTMYISNEGKDEEPGKIYVFKSKAG
jgi:uncharacterized protein YjiK